MATRITKAITDPMEFPDRILLPQLKMVDGWVKMSGLISYYQYNAIIAPIIAKGNRFDGEIAEA